MGIILNDNIKIKAGKPIDSKYLSSGNTSYLSASAANAELPISERYVGLTVLVNNIEYWYKDGVDDVDLVVKFGIICDYISGATNLGYFSGFNGLQSLPIDQLADDSFDGDYVCLYNNYYRGSDGIIHVGTPSDGINKRAYYSTGTSKSWIWSEYVSGSDLLGWTFIDGDVSELIGTFQTTDLPRYYTGGTSLPYANTSWTDSTVYNNGTNAVVNAVEGSITTGDTITIGVRPYSFTEDNLLKFRSFKSETPNLVNFREDEAFIYLSASTYQGENIGSLGVGVYSGMDGNTFQYRKIIGSGDTNVCVVGDNVVVHTSAASGATSLTVKNVTGVTSGSTFYVAQYDEYVGISGVSGTTGSTNVYLYDTPESGQKRVVVADISGNAGTYPITVHGNGNLINNETSGVINTDYGSFTFIYNNYFWNIVNPL